MAGYIGSKTVNLSTTGADIAGDADVSGALDVGGAFTSQGIDDNATSTAMTLDASGNVDIAGTLTSDGLTVNDTLRLDNEDATVSTGDIFGDIEFYDNDGGSASAGVTAKIEAKVESSYGASSLIFYTSSSSGGAREALTEQIKIDAGGNLLVGATSVTGIGSGTNEGVSISSSQKQIVVGVDSDVALYLNRQNSDGSIALFRRDGTSVGSIGTLSGDFFIASSVSSGSGLLLDANTLRPMRNGALADNIIDLGGASQRFDDIYATNGNIQTSDRNEKQDIAELTDAEQRVAVAAKGLLRKFRWRDAVEAKGDEARTHFGIIAQDLQAAFAAEGLDAGGYAMFISTTWWEHDVEVPAVEAVAEVLDEEGNVVTEAVEAVDAYTRTDTYEKQEEAPEGATERTRLGVRYSELLAFMIGAL